VPNSLRVLVAGWLNSPHVTAWVDAVAAAGHDVHLAGRAVPHWPSVEVAASVHSLPADGLPLVRSLRMSRALGDVAAAVKPHLVHAHWLPELGWMAAREGLRPLICSAWGSDVFRAHGFGRRRSKRALDGSELVLASSEDLARATRELAGRDIQVEVVRWGLELERFTPGESGAAREALGIQHDGPLIVDVRGLDDLYNPELLLEAFATVRQTHPKVQLLLCHTLKPLPNKVMNAIDQLGLNDEVTMLPFVPHERMPDVYRAADVIVSIASSDSSPRSVWEALACGRPVVVSDLPWARDELSPGHQALLVPLEREAIAAAIGRALDDTPLARRLGKEAREAALAVAVDPTALAERIDQLYRSVVQAAA
jgi:L-malate glycosyltransferase